MRLIYFTEKEEEKIKNILEEKNTFFIVVIASQYGKYKKGEYVKTSWGQRLLVIDAILIKDFEDFKQKYVHYPELKDTDLEAVQKAFVYKKVELIQLKKYR